MNQWISVKERLPESDKDVLVYTIYGTCSCARYEICDEDTSFWNSMDDSVDEEITHWMELPDAPVD